MLLMLLTLLMTDAPAQWVFGDTGVFEPLRRNEVAVAANGDVYILNFDESVVLRYDPQGKNLGKFGGKGEGPGEFSHPNQVFVDESRLYVQDLGRDTMHFFDRAGKFEKTLSLPAQGLELAKVKGGWIHIDSLGMSGGASPIQVTFVDENFQNPKKILSLARGPARGLRVEVNGANQRPVAKFNPVADGPSLIGSSDGRVAWVKGGGSAVIHVIDAGKQAVVSEIKPSIKALPFNQEYGQQRFEEISSDMKKRNSPVVLEADFPSTFPIVRELASDGDGHLLVRCWTGRPGKDEKYLMYDATGKEMTLPCKADYIPRLMAIRGKQAWLSASPEEDDAYLVRVPLGQLDKAITAHPQDCITKPRMLMRTNYARLRRGPDPAASGFGQAETRILKLVVEGLGSEAKRCGGPLAVAGEAP